MSRSKRSAGLRTLALIALTALVVLVALNLGFTALGDLALGRSAFRFSRISRGDIAVDVLVVGNSRGVNTLTGTAPGASPSVFNLSYNALNRAAIIALTKDYFAQGNHAKVVLIEASGLFGEGANCELKPYWDRLANLRQEGAAGCGDDGAMARYLPLTRFNAELFQRAAYYALRGHGSDQDWRNNGRIAQPRCDRYARQGDPNFQPAGRVEQAAAVRREVDGLRVWLGQHAPGTRLRFVLAPYLASAATEGPVGGSVRAADAALGRGAYLDLSHGLGADCPAFADLVHINDLGRARTRAAVLKSLGF